LLIDAWITWFGCRLSLITFLLLGLGGALLPTYEVTADQKDYQIPSLLDGSTC
jgi:hypothetical protein